MLPELPAHPRLADGVELVAGPGDLLQLRGCIPPLRLTGRMPHRLLPLLDGAHSLEAITGALDEWPPDEVLAALGALAAHGLIAAAPHAGEGRAQAAFYWAAASDPADRGEQTRRAVRSARLHLFGWGSLHLELADGLRRCGSEALTAEAWPPFPTPDELQERFPGRAAADLALVALPRPAPAILAAANAASLRQGVPFLPVVVSGSEAVIGPAVLPGRSACYECFRHRLRTHAAFPDDDAAYEAHLDRTDPAGVLLPEWPPFTAAVAALAAMEAIRLATRFTQPRTAGQVLFVDALTGSHRISRVWKLPRCPACGRVRSGPGGGEPDGEP